MYAKPSLVGIGIATGTLAFTGFAVASYVVTATILIVGGMLLVRASRRRASHR
jgi:hypothetical protein